MLDFKNVHSRDEIHRAVFSTLAANGMRDNTHIRLTMSRGEKVPCPCHTARFNQTLQSHPSTHPTNPPHQTIPPAPLSDDKFDEP